VRTTQLAQQQARAKTTQRRTTLMLEEMGQLEASVPTYKQVGKA
jgi:chaperonin cofactor prefoldin